MKSWETRAQSKQESWFPLTAIVALKASPRTRSSPGAFSVQVVPVGTNDNTNLRLGLQLHSLYFSSERNTLTRSHYDTAASHYGVSCTFSSICFCCSKAETNLFWSPWRGCWVNFQLNLERIAAPNIHVKFSELFQWLLYFTSLGEFCKDVGHILIGVYWVWFLFVCLFFFCFCCFGFVSLWYLEAIMSCTLFLPSSKVLLILFSSLKLLNTMC